MGGAIDQPPLRVLLIGNYAPDRQESMQRFAQTLATHLPERGLDVRLLRPEARLGRLHAGTHGIGKWLGYIDKFVFFPRQLARELAQT
jgi:hypothetical protein